MSIQELISKTDNSYPTIDWSKINSFVPKLKASFVIPVINSENTISLVLNAIENQHSKDSISEVILIDNSENTKTRDSIELYLQNTTLKNVIYSNNGSNKGTAYSRNRGIEQATGDVICFVDTDIVIPPDYLNYHLFLHERFDNLISVSLRSDISQEAFEKLKSPFPVKAYNNEFRLMATVKPERCKTPSQLKFAGKKMNLVKDTNAFRDLGNGNSMYWTLADMCLTCSVSYKAQKLKELKGAPENFIEYGCEDSAMAAKVIATGAYVVPIIDAGVYHLEHPRRYGKDFRKGYERNLRRLEKLYTLTLEESCFFDVPKLNIE